VDQQPATSLPSFLDNGDVYDLVLNDLPYGVDFYVELAREAHGPVLEIACGTGRILLPCLQAGVDIEGLDLVAADGSVQTLYRSQDSSRYIYKHEMALLLRAAGFARWEIYGDFDRRPLTLENDAMVVTAQNA
jgi:hypothetical protein